MEELISQVCPEFKAKGQLRLRFVSRVVASAHSLAHEAKFFEKHGGTGVRDQIRELKPLNDTRVLLNGNLANSIQTALTDELVTGVRGAKDSLIEKRGQIEPFESVKLG